MPLEISNQFLSLVCFKPP